MEYKDRGYRIANHYNPMTGFIQLCVEKSYTDLFTGQAGYSICKWITNREEGKRYISLMTGRKGV